MEAVADEIGVLSDGQLVAEGSPTDVKARAETGERGSLEDAFLAVTKEETTAHGNAIE